MKIRGRKKVKFYILAILLLVVTSYTLFIVAKSVFFWYAVRNISSTNGLTAFCKADEMVSYRSMPNINGEARYLYPDSSKVIPIYTDEDGNRSSITARQVDTSKKFLFLGCSYTFGEYCDADSTYPFIVSRHFGAHCYNTAMSGYGYGHMLFRAKELIPLYKPDVVFVQYSDWLIDRSQSVYSTSTKQLKVFIPFFSKDEQGIHLMQPVSTNKDMLNIIRSISENRTGFFVQVGLILQTAGVLIKKDFVSVKIYLLQKLGLIPVPAPNDQEICNYVLDQFQRLCSDNNCKLVIVGINDQTLAVGSDLLYINTQRALQQNADSLHRGYDTLFCHWTQHPVKCFNCHPNHYANGVIASEIIRGITPLFLNP